MTIPTWEYGEERMAASPPFFPLFLHHIANVILSAAKDLI
jgi:hypothetical protein